MPFPDDLLGVDRDPAGPLITYYDDATGERAELSATTLRNWVAKTANLLVDDAGVQPGDRVAVLLPAHWQTVAVSLGAWAAGGVVTTDPAGAAVAFTGVAGVARAAAAGSGEIFALSLAPLGRGLDGPEGRALDYALEVRAHGDHFSGPAVGGAAPALADPPLSGADLLAEARIRADRFGLAAGDRVLSTLPWSTSRDWLAGWLAPLSCGASLVQCANPAGTAELAARAGAERATATLGCALPDLRRLDG